MRVLASVVALCMLVLSIVSPASARAILGIDLGSLYMKVALVQSGAPLEIVTNLHSKRKTEQMILFEKTTQQRFYGADANALLARKATQTPVAMSVMLGREESHPNVQVLQERHYPITPTYNETRAGVTVTVNSDHHYTPEELVAMVMQHAVDISVAYAVEKGMDIPPPRDVVLTVPVYATAHERKALLDAAALADLNVLTLIDETTAAALHYAMDKTFEEEEVILFYNLGASALQVSVVRFFNYEQPQKYGKNKTVPALQVVAKAWDATCGGLAFDHAIVELLADEFNAQWKSGKDVRDVPRAMTKLRLQANKIKHVLSANTEIPVFMDSVYDDVSLQTMVTRAQLETLTADLLERSIAPVAEALKQMKEANVTALTAMELIGGGMRVPAIQQKLKEAVTDVELGLHINADESFALGASFAGANISTAFRVRHVGMTDISPFGVKVSLTDGNDESSTEEAWSKQATLFKPNGKVGVKKTIAFTHETDIHCALDYAENERLPPGTELALERYSVTGITEFAEEMQEKGLGKPKVSLQFELSSSGITSLIKAEAAVEETYTIEEEVEVADEEATDEATESESIEEKETSEGASSEAKEDDEKKNEKEEKKPKKKIVVEKEKKKIHKKTLGVDTYYVSRVQPHSEELLAESKMKLADLDQQDKGRMLLEESKNKVESYIYKIKNKLVDDEEVINKVSNKKQREEVKKLGEAAEEWLYEDGYTADLATMEDKYAELSVPFEKILLRIAESTARPEAVGKFRKKLEDVENLMAKWEENKPQVTEEERKSVLDKVSEARKWIDDKEKAQQKKKDHDEPAFLSSDVPPQFKPIEAQVVRLGRKPKPKPEKKNETEATENSTSTRQGESESPEDGNQTKSEEAASEESKSAETDGSEETEATEKAEAPEKTSQAAGEEL